MSDEAVGLDFILEDPRVLSVRCMSGPSDDEMDAHTNWYVSFDPEPEEETGSHVVIATLHGGYDSARADVVVGGRFRRTYPDVPLSEDLFGARLAASLSLETLYDFARSHMATIFGIIGESLEAPASSPEAEVSSFLDTDEELESSSHDH